MSVVSEQIAWYALRTRARSEKVVTRRLGDRGVEVYCPLVERERQWADRKKKVGFPMFPGYVFARFDPAASVEVFRVPGVVGVVRTEGQPTPVRSEELDAVRRLETGISTTGQEPHPADFLQAGDEIVVTEGPFEGMTGVLLEARGGTRVAVKLSAIRQAVSIDLPREFLRPAG